MRFGSLLAAVVSTLAVSVAGVSGAQAQQWPTRPITVISPYPPGGTNDIVGRLFTDKMAAKLGQPIVVENRPGAAGIVGSLAVSRAAPDGYTLLIANNGALVVQPLVSAQAKYDVLTSFTPIARLAVSYPYLGINADLPVNTLAELVEYARKMPGKLNFGSAGTGSFGQFCSEMLKLQSGIDMVHVPYRGSSAAVTDLAGGQIQVMFDPLVLSQKESGRVRVLAMTGPQRSKRYPDIPTTKEAGFPDLDPIGWFGFFGPPGLPKEIVQKFADAAAEVAKDPEIAQRLEAAGVDPGFLPPDQFAATLAPYKAKFEDIAKRANIQVAQ
jgi:tripartite-type tricarboxylate transporter receptor subunit TctC